MGHAMLALVAWAQRCCLLAGLGARGLPPAFRGFGAAFAWSVADVASPFDGLADPAARGWPAGEPERGLAPALVRLDAAGGLAEALPLPLNSTAPLAALAGYPGPDADPGTVRAQPPAWLLRPEALRQPPAPPAPPPSDASHAAGLEPAVDDLLRPYFPICAPPVAPLRPPAHACLTRAHAAAQPCGNAGHSACVIRSGILLNESRWRGQGVEHSQVQLAKQHGEVGSDLLTHAPHPRAVPAPAPHPPPRPPAADQASLGLLASAQRGGLGAPRRPALPPAARWSGGRVGPGSALRQAGTPQQHAGVSFAVRPAGGGSDGSAALAPGSGAGLVPESMLAPMPAAGSLAAGAAPAPAAATPAWPGEPADPALAPLAAAPSTAEVWEVAGSQAAADLADLNLPPAASRQAPAVAPGAGHAGAGAAFSYIPAGRGSTPPAAPAAAAPAAAALGQEPAPAAARPNQAAEPAPALRSAATPGPRAALLGRRRLLERAGARRAHAAQPAGSLAGPARRRLDASAPDAARGGAQYILVTSTGAEGGPPGAPRAAGEEALADLRRIQVRRRGWAPRRPGPPRPPLWGCARSSMHA